MMRGHLDENMGQNEKNSFSVLYFGRPIFFGANLSSKNRCVYFEITCCLLEGGFFYMTANLFVEVIFAK